MEHFNSLRDFTLGSLKGKTVLVRTDFNVSLDHEGNISDFYRLKTVFPTLLFLQEKQARIIILSHWGRPKGNLDPRFSFERILPHLKKMRPNVPITFCPGTNKDYIRETIAQSSPREIILLENLRFHPEEEKNDINFAQFLAKLGHLYVNDALSICHRKHASVVSIPLFLPSIMGFFLEEEHKTLTQALTDSQKPLFALIGGSKISTKIKVIKNLIHKVNTLAIGGAMANTFLKQQGFSLGTSFVENDFLDITSLIQREAISTGCSLLLPKDFQLKTPFGPRLSGLHSIKDEEQICDIGPKTCLEWSNHFQKANTVIWNGPLGIVELPPFHLGTMHMAKKIAYHTQNKPLFSVAGGGDTLLALKKAEVSSHFTCTSSAGGAFLEWLEGNTLPGLDALKNSCVYSSKGLNSL